MVSLGMYWCLMVALLCTGRAEEVFHARDRHDIIQFHQRDPRRDQVGELIYAEELLEKYGYLKCVPPGTEGNVGLHRLLLHRRREGDPTSFENLDYRDRTSGSWRQSSIFHHTRNRHQMVTVKDGERVAYLPLCSQRDIQEAVSKFQQTYDLGTSKLGGLDSSTLQLLTSPRCGNPDDLMDEHSRPVDPVLHYLRRRRRRSIKLLSPDRNKNEKIKEDTNKPKQENLLDSGSEYTGKTFRLAKDLAENKTVKNVTDYGKLKISDLFSSNENKTYTDLLDISHIKNNISHQSKLMISAYMWRKKIINKYPAQSQYTEAEPHPNIAITRRRRWISDLHSRIDSGSHDSYLTSLHGTATRARTLNRNEKASRERWKRSAYTHLGTFFDQQEMITWRLGTAGYSSQLGVGVQRAALGLAFRMWSEVIPNVFYEDKLSPIEHVDINIGFGRRAHLGCVTEFDGMGGELSHAMREPQEAQIHIDDDEHFTLDSEHGTNLLKVAVHEIGHVLGMGHVVRNYSIMYAIYEKLAPNQGLELGWEDRKLVQKMYGICSGSFSTVMDYLRWTPEGTLTYNTYFFRDDHYWMYENRYNRTRFGDPLLVRPEWRGLPEKFNAYTHLWTKKKNFHLFFKGKHYYKYDAVKDRVSKGYPRRIAHDFHGPGKKGKKNRSNNIPSNLDAAFFDKRDGNIYFFKGAKVWGYNVSLGSSGCCLPGYPRPITEEFTTADEFSRPLPSHIDAVYYSYTDQTVFFFKDRFFWELVTFHPQDYFRTNLIVGPFLTHDKWYDICDTDLDPYQLYQLG